MCCHFERGLGERYPQQEPGRKNYFRLPRAYLALSEIAQEGKTKFSYSPGVSCSMQVRQLLKSGFRSLWRILLRASDLLSLIEKSATDSSGNFYPVPESILGSRAPQTICAAHSTLTRRRESHLRTSAAVGVNMSEQLLPSCHSFRIRNKRPRLELLPESFKSHRLTGSRIRSPLR